MTENAFSDSWAEEAAARQRKSRMGITINPIPLMTQYLIRETEIFKNGPFVLIDVGARGGLSPHWDVLKPHLKAILYEPDELQCAAMAANAPDWMTIIPRALDTSSGTRKFYQTRLPDCDGFYKANMDYMGQLVNGKNNEAIGEKIVATGPLAERADFIKLDAEGAELDILQGANLNGVLGIISEFRFHQEINGCPPFSELDKHLRMRSFQLYDMSFNYQSRKDLPYPQKVRAIGQDGKPFMGVTTRGQIQDGDALYFRDAIAGRELWPETRFLKLACLMELYSLNDCAAEILSKGQDHWSVDWRRCRDLLASGIAEEPTTYEAYRTKYFA